MPQDGEKINAGFPVVRRRQPAALPGPAHEMRLVVCEPDYAAFHPPQKAGLWHGLQGVRNSLVRWLGEEEAYGARFLFLPVFSGAGAIAYFCLETEPSWEQLVLLALLAGALAYLFRHIRSLMLLSGFLLFSVLGALCAKGESARLATVMIGSELSTLATGRIMALEEAESGGYRLVLALVATQRPVLQNGPDRVRLAARLLPEGAAVGAGLKGFVRLRPPSGPARPGAYDFSFHHYYRGIGAQGFFMGMPKLVPVPPPGGLAERAEVAIAKLRSLMTQRITAAIPGEAGAVSAALITGQRGKISRAANDALRLSGLAHILSISGLHMAMVTGMVLVVIRGALGLFPVFSSRYPSRKIAAVVAFFVSAFYLLLSGADVAAQRSFVMVAVMLAAVLFDRAAITMRNLAIAALITIIVVPHELMGPSFQMSFAATAALVAAFGWWSRRRRASGDDGKSRRRSRLLALTVVPLVSTGVASLVAGVASGLYAAFHFNNTAPFGILSNALAFPVMSVGVMPFALLAAVLMPFHLDWLALQIMGAGVSMVQKIAFQVAAISPAANPGAMTPRSLAVLTAGLVLLLFLRSPLKYAFFLLLGCGLIMHGRTLPPLALISENGRLAAIVRSDGKLAVSTPHPPAFMINNWRAAFGTGDVVGPHALDTDVPDTVMRCKAHYCQARLANGKIFAMARLAGQRQKACENGDIAFLDFPGHAPACPGKVTVTRQHLALYGAVEIRPVTGGMTLVWACGPSSRPWNKHRRFSKTAREMP